MADRDEQERAAKLAAGKKRYEQLKKQNQKGKKAAISKKNDEKTIEEVTPSEDVVSQDKASGNPTAKGSDVFKQEAAAEHSEAVNDISQRDHDDGDRDSGETEKHTRQPSLSLESRIRSKSFRQATPIMSPSSPSATDPKSPNIPALNADGESMTEIYRKQAARVEELEKENRRLAKEAKEGASRWRALETELEELRESRSGDLDLRSKADQVGALEQEVAKLRSEHTALQRQNSQLSSQRPNRHSSSPSTGTFTTSAVDLQGQLNSKQATIESIELELSTLRARIAKSPDDSHREQIVALEEKVIRAEGAAGTAQRELFDLRRNLDRASEKAVKDGTERISVETKLKTLEREAADFKHKFEESSARVETLEKKLSALTNLHKESDGRRVAGDRARDRLENEATNLRRRFAALENENMQIREERERMRRKEASTTGANDDEGLDELEEEGRKRLQHRIRDLEGEISDLRRGIWRDQRRVLEQEDGPGSPGNKFDEIDLSGPSPTFRRPSMTTAHSRASGFTNVLTSGFNALTGGALATNDDDLLDDEFDEDIYRQAQEDETKKERDRLDGIKSDLQKWKGWRMDIVNSRVGTIGKGMGEIFDI